MHIATDPRINAPECLSKLHGDDRMRLIAIRDRTYRAAFMAPYEQPAALSPARRFILRWEYVLTGAVVFAAVVAGVSL